MDTLTRQPSSPGGSPVASPGAAPSVGASPQLNSEALIAQAGITNASAHIEAIEKKRNSRVICLVYNEAIPQLAAAIAPPLIGVLEQLLAGIGKMPNLDLLLRTTGGMTEVPWRIVSMLREFTSDRLGVIVSRIALSGGSHVALAADDLVMGPFSTLSSVDPTRQHPLLTRDPITNQPIPTSVQDLKHCIQFIREQLGESYPTQNLALIISELFKYVNPLALGALEQSYALSRLITEKVLRTRKQSLDEMQIKKITEILSGQYFSHAFMISRAEVKSDLGLPVTEPDTELSDLIAAYEAYYITEFQKMLPIQGAQEKLHIGGVVETRTTGYAILQIVKPDLTVAADPWLKFR